MTCPGVCPQEACLQAGSVVPSLGSAVQLQTPAAFAPNNFLLPAVIRTAHKAVPGTAAGGGSDLHIRQVAAVANRRQISHPRGCCSVRPLRHRGLEAGGKLALAGGGRAAVELQPGRRTDGCSAPGRGGLLLVLLLPPLSRLRQDSANRAHLSPQQPSCLLRVGAWQGACFHSYTTPKHSECMMSTKQCQRGKEAEVVFPNAAAFPSVRGRGTCSSSVDFPLPAAPPSSSGGAGPAADRRARRKASSAGRG